MEQTKIKVEDYGDMLAKIKSLDLVEYKELGDYQGDYLAVLKDKKTLYFYFDVYGSCSGCDWLEAEKDWSTNELDYKSALDYCQQITLKYSMPIELWNSLSDEQKLTLLSIENYAWGTDKAELKELLLKINPQINAN